MLSRAPGNLLPLTVNQATASPSLTDSTKRFCKAWPSSGRGDLLLEPTSVLELRSPSPSSTLSSSFAGSYEGGVGSIESGAVAVSRLFCEAASDGHLPGSASLIDINEGSDWAIARDNGSEGEEDFPLGVVAVSSWHGHADMGGELNGQWEQISLGQGTGVVGAQENVEGPPSGMNGSGRPSAADMVVGNSVAASFGSSVYRSSAGVAVQRRQMKWGDEGGVEKRENSCKAEKVEQFSFPNSSNISAGGNKLQAGQEVMNGEALGRLVADGRLEACVISYYQAEAGRKRDQGDFLGEVVHQKIDGGGVGGRSVSGQEECLPDWNDLQVGAASEKAAVAGQIGSMEDLEVLLGMSAPPPQEWWLAESGGEDPSFLLQQHAQSSQIYQFHAQGVGGLPQLRILSQGGGGGGASSSNSGVPVARRQLDLHEAMQAGLLVSRAPPPSSAPEIGGIFPRHSSAASFPPNGFLSSANLSPVPAALSRSNSILAPQIDFSSFAVPPHHPLAANLESRQSKFQQQLPLPPPPLQQHLRDPVAASSLLPPFAPDFLLRSDSKLSSLPLHHPPSAAATVASLPPHTAACFSSTPFSLPQLPHQSSHLSSEHLSRAQLFPLPYGPLNSDQLLGLPKTVHRVQDADFLHKNVRFLSKAEPGWQAPRQRSEDPFHRLVRSPPPSQDRLLPHVQLPESRCVGRKVRLDEILLAASQLAMAANAVDQGNIGMAQAILARLNQQNSPNGQPSQRAVFHFKEALAKRVAGSGSSFQLSSNSSLEVINKIGAYKSFCEISPLAQFAHFTANQAILEAVEGEDHVHLIDFELELGGQWASFMQEISQRSGGPPDLRITTVGSDSFEMQLTRENLQQFARELNISLEFYALPVSRLDCLTTSMFPRGEKEAVAVNFGCGLDRLLSNFPSADSLTSFLQLIRSLSPKVVAVVDNEWQSDASSPFLDALQFYACLFESLECSKLPSETVLGIETSLFAPKIASVVNGKKRIDNWRSLLQKAGFSPVTFSNAAESQARYLTGSPNTGFTFDKKHNNLLLGWHNKPLLSVSAWLC